MSADANLVTCDDTKKADTHLCTRHVKNQYIVPVYGNTMLKLGSAGSQALRIISIALVSPVVFTLFVLRKVCKSVLPKNSPFSQSPWSGQLFYPDCQGGDSTPHF